MAPISDSVFPGSLVLRLDPVPCPRPRISKWGTYYPAKYKQWKQQAEQLLCDAYDGELIAAPVSVALTFVVKRPKTTKLLAPKPDLDNYCKAALDAMTGTVLRDDHLVWCLNAEKMWASPGRDGCLIIGLDLL